MVVNRLMLEDIDHPYLPTLSVMLHQGAVGLISPNCSGGKSETSVVLTANAGSPARGGSFVKQFFDYDERTPDGMLARDAYAARTGRKAPKGSAVFLGLGQALRENEKLNTVPARLGALGDALHAQGLKTGIVGNADRVAWSKDDEPLDRSAAALAMDSRGIVDCGNYIILPHSILAGNNPRLLVPQADLLVVTLGGFVDLDESRISLTDAAFVAQQNRCLTDLDAMLDTIISLHPEGTTIVLVSFSPPKGPAWDQLTPIVVYPSKKAGLLTSASSRTPGLIAASDFAPTILQLMNVDVPGDLLGRAATVVPGRDAVEKLQRMSGRVTTNRRMLLPVGVAMAVVSSLAMTAAAVVLAFGLKPSRRLLGLIRAGLVAAGCVAPSLFLVSLGPAGVAGYIGTAAVALVALVWICSAVGAVVSRKTNLRAAPIVAAFGISALMILTDAATGGSMCRWAGFSSFQISGMRYYGIGNEYAAVLIAGAALVTLLLATSREQRSGEAGERSRAMVAAVGLVVVVALGYGAFGANYGGTAAAVVTFGLLWIAMSRRGFGARHVVLVCAVAVAVVVTLALIDWKLAGAAGSHAAGATGLAEKLGSGYVASIALRKVLFNLKLVASAKTIGPVLAFTPFLALWFCGIQGKMRALFKSDSRVLAGAKAVIIGAAAAFVLNDSGILFGMVMIAMTVLALLYSVLEEHGVESGERKAVEGRPLPSPSPKEGGEEEPCPG